MKMVKWLYVMALLAAMPAYAESPFKVRGIALGDTQAQVRAQHRYASCNQLDAPRMGEVVCNIEGYGGDDRATVLYSVISGRVESVTVLLDAVEYGGLMQAIRFKHGAPHSDIYSTYNNRVLTWFDAASWQTLKVEEGYVLTTVTLKSWDGVRAERGRVRLGNEANADKL